MDKQYVPYEEARELIWLGFEMKTPLYQEAFDFLREKFGIIHNVSPRSWSDEHPIKWSVWYNFLGTTETYPHFMMSIALGDRENDDPYNTFEEARLEALRLMVEDVKKKLNG